MTRSYHVKAAQFTVYTDSQLKGKKTIAVPVLGKGRRPKKVVLLKERSVKGGGGEGSTSVR